MIVVWLARILFLACVACQILDQKQPSGKNNTVITNSRTIDQSGESTLDNTHKYLRMKRQEEGHEDDANDVIGKYMPDIDYALKGYDIFFGNPHASDADTDPGFRAAIFKVDYSDNNISGDKRFNIPNGMEIIKCNHNCKIDMSTTMIKGTKSYQKTLEAKASVTGSVPVLASFSASADYKEIKKHIEEEHYLYTSTEVTCCVYVATIKPYKQPEFTDDFKSGVNTLKEEYNEKTYDNFIKAYGTHYIKKAHLGAVYGQQSSISKSKWSDLERTEIDIKAAANYNGRFNLNVEGGTKKETELAKTFENAVEKHKKYFFGQKPPKDGNVSTWINMVKAEPQPIKLELASLDTLEGLKEYLEEKKKPKVLDNLKDSLKSYCSRLKEERIVSSCEAPKASCWNYVFVSLSGDVAAKQSSRGGLYKKDGKFREVDYWKKQQGEKAIWFSDKAQNEESSWRIGLKKAFKTGESSLESNGVSPCPEGLEWKYYDRVSKRWFEAGKRATVLPYYKGTCSEEIFVSLSGDAKSFHKTTPGKYIKQKDESGGLPYWLMTDVSDRVHAIWFDNNRGRWRIGPDPQKHLGGDIAVMYSTSSAVCPTALKWVYLDKNNPKNWIEAGEDVRVEQDVSCGEYRASSCSQCDEGRGKSLCNGECIWEFEHCFH